MKQNRILLINPWIRDFAAYDLWCKPLALLTLATWFRNAGFAVDMIDCLDRYHPKLLANRPPDWTEKQGDSYFCNKFTKKLLNPPESVAHIDRPYYQYGLPENIFFEDLRALPRPDICCISSMMTYWYPAAQHMVACIKSVYPDVPVIAGGIYPTLLYDHACKHLNADYVHSGAPDDRLVSFINDTLGGSFRFEPYDPLMEPAFDLIHNKNSLSVMTSVGCPFSCTYCASKYLHSKYRRLNYKTVFDRLQKYVEDYKTGCFAFYDDALLFEASDHIVPFLRLWLDSGLQATFHTPNGLHARFLTDELASLMYRAGFRTLRLSLETTSAQRQKSTGGKIYLDEMRRAIDTLYNAGFTSEHFALYMLIGLPDQTKDEILQDIKIVHDMGARIDLSSFSPIPKTPVWDELMKDEPLEFVEPLKYGKTVYFLQAGALSLDEMRQLRRYVSNLNKQI
ncbi:MAG: B12-binding domain-containing radical SAM protein [Candidatus Auribacterota bacterium]|jgi:radical SAM superfamily enzyme YgiQ (UPF0313 family)|nr:B12-binding domain-containing radical SAM protein [Candidatus Auribacterota bacterium]